MLLSRKMIRVESTEFLLVIYYEVIDCSECGELMDEGEAREAFDKLSATAKRVNENTIEVRIPVLVRGEEELEEDVPEGKNHSIIWQNMRK